MNCITDEPARNRLYRLSRIGAGTAMTNPVLYKPVIGIMLAGLTTIMFLKLRKNGFADDGWMDAPLGIVLVADLFFARN